MKTLPVYPGKTIVVDNKNFERFSKLILSFNANRLPYVTCRKRGTKDETMLAKLVKPCDRTFSIEYIDQNIFNCQESNLRPVKKNLGKKYKKRIKYY